MKIVQDMEFVFNLINKIKLGRVAPAVMQRPYVWSKQDVLELFDSMANDLPIGSLCLWGSDPKTNLQVSRKARMANFSTFSDSANLLILDGQNRLATIAYALANDLHLLDRGTIPQHEQDVWLDGSTLSFDCSNQQFLFALPHDLADPHRLIVPMHILLNGKETAFLLNHFRNSPSGLVDVFDAQFASLDRVRSRIMSSRVIVSTIHNATLEQAKYVFLRLCKAGVPISESDLEFCLRAVDI